MGHGIAQSFAAKGFQVSGFDELDSVRNTVKERIRANIHSAVTVGFVKVRPRPCKTQILL